MVCIWIKKADGAGKPAGPLQAYAHTLPPLAEVWQLLSESDTEIIESHHTVSWRKASRKPNEKLEDPENQKHTNSQLLLGKGFVTQSSQPESMTGNYGN